MFDSLTGDPLVVAGVSAVLASATSFLIESKILPRITQIIDNYIEGEAQKMPPLVIHQPSKPHIIDFNRSYCE